MPVEIRELIIKATVEQEGAGATGANSAAAAGGNQSPTQALISMCVDKVLEILKEKNER
jgi:hypothetical protein